MPKSFVYISEAELTAEEEEKLDDKQKLERFGRETARCMANKMVCVVVSHPLQATYNYYLTT